MTGNWRKSNIRIDQRKREKYSNRCPFILKTIDLYLHPQDAQRERITTAMAQIAAIPQHRKLLKEVEESKEEVKVLKEDVG